MRHILRPHRPSFVILYSSYRIFNTDLANILGNIVSFDPVMDLIAQVAQLQAQGYTSLDKGLPVLWAEG